MKVLNKLNVGGIVYVKQQPGDVVLTFSKPGDTLVYLGVFSTENKKVLRQQFLNTRTGIIIHFNVDINDCISFGKEG